MARTEDERGAGETATRVTLTKAHLNWWVFYLTIIERVILSLSDLSLIK